MTSLTSIRGYWLRTRSSCSQDGGSHAKNLVLCHGTAHDEDGQEYPAYVSSIHTWVAGWALAFRQHTPDPDSSLQDPIR